MGEANTLTENFHATSVAIGTRALLIRGAAGSGKSSLALEMISRGAGLISDDISTVQQRKGVLIAIPPANRRGQIEARGVGILQLPCASATPLVAVVDLDSLETERLPKLRKTTLLSLPLPVLFKLESPHFAAILCAYLTGERIEP